MAPELDCITPPQPMEGYLKKSKKWAKRYFVLREGPPPCLEYYDSAKRKHGKPKRTLNLKNAWNIDKKVSSKHKHLIGIYTEGEYFALAAESITAQDAWVRALKRAVQGSKGRVNTTHLMYKHIWHGTVDTKDLEGCDPKAKLNLHGSHRCCLTDKTMVFVRLNSSGSCNLQAHSHIEVPISNIRSCGHRDNMFFMEPGRSSGIGTGKLWMELEDPLIADNMHKSLLELMKCGDDDRQRSYSFGSTGRPSINRSRHYYNPPPSQVGLGKPANPTTLPKQASFIGGRNRCESFPATQAATLTDESRYRTSSEGETTMKRPFARHSLGFRKGGSISPNARSRSFLKRPPFLPASLVHYRSPSSLPGSYTSSSNSSVEHINSSHDYFRNGQSPAASESHGSSDELSFSPLTDVVGSQSHIRFALLSYSGSLELAPPPPAVAPLTTPLTSLATSTATSQMSEYESMQPSHSRSHSLDDNLGCGTATSSLSASPQTMSFLPGVSPDTSYLYSQSPSQCSSHSQSDVTGQIFTPTSTSPDEYSMMTPGCSEVYPHESSRSKEQNFSDYTPMTPGRGAASTSTPVDDKSEYVPMQSLAKSQPQDIIPRRRSLSDNRLVNGSYSPASPLSRSPEKLLYGNGSFPLGPTCSKCNMNLSRSYPCQCSSVMVAAKNSTIPTYSCHGLKVDAKNDFSFDFNRPKNYASKTSKPNEHSPSSYGDDYASMGKVQPSSSTRCTNEDTKEFPDETDVEHEYLPMSPMNAANSKKSVVSNVLSIAESASKSSQSASAPTPKYPHQRNVSKPADYCTNSLDRSSSKPRRRTKSLFGAALASGNRISRASKQGRKSSLRINIEPKNCTSEASSSHPEPPLSPGGEYVSISFDKAKKQVGPDYVSLTESAVLPDASASSQTPALPTVTHDSNRNIVPTKSTPKDEYSSLRKSDEREAQL